MELPQELEVAAFRSQDGEYAWQRSQALDAVLALANSGRAILGGELWLVRDGQIFVELHRRSGPAEVYTWATERLREEPWPTYVARACGKALAAIQAPLLAEVIVPSNAKVYYNLTWADADE